MLPITHLQMSNLTFDGSRRNTVSPKIPYHLKFQMFFFYNFLYFFHFFFASGMNLIYHHYNSSIFHQPLVWHVWVFKQVYSINHLHTIKSQKIFKEDRFFKISSSLQFSSIEFLVQPLHWLSWWAKILRNKLN